MARSLMPLVWRYHSRVGVAYSTTVRATLSKTQEQEIKRCLTALSLDSTSIDSHSTESVRDAYLELAKRYHPDSGAASADREQFEAASAAYQTLYEFYRTHSPMAEPAVEEEEELKDAEARLTPQHRQYLEFEGVGYGTPSQRRSQYDRWRADKASERVFQYRKDAMLRDDSSSSVAVKQEKEKKYTRRIKTSNLLLRMADDMIKESMANGEFENLAGSGKPLKSSSDHNPYVDAHTHKLNSILISNGFTPEWMNLEHEIKSSYAKLKAALRRAYEKYHPASAKVWSKEVTEFRREVEALNQRVDKLNMIVPSLKLQMAHYNADIALKKLMDKPSDKVL